MKKVWLILFGLVVSLHLQAQVNSVVAGIDKNPVMVDEAIRLSVTATGDADRDAFDSSPLLNDFVVGRTSISNRTSIVNGSRTDSVTWTTVLFPRDKGTFTIPSFSIGGQQTQPIQVKVIPVQQAGEDQQQEARDYYVTTSADSTEVYLHQQIRYTVKLYLASDIERGTLQAPEMEQAQISQLGDDKRSTEIVNGRRYTVIERNFAVVPQRSGEYRLRGPVFTGEVMAPNTRQSFGFFNRTQTINRLGPDITITVKPEPADIDYHWLPSEYVDINEEWPQNATFKVGEPVTRTITLTATGVVEEQLPEFPKNYPPGFKTYPDQAKTATVDKNNTLIAQRVESTAVIPTKPGLFVLPDITIPWFNVSTGQTEYAKLPARQIEVKPDTAASAAPAPPPSTAGTSDNTAVAPTTEQPATESPAVPSSPWLMILSALVLLLVVLLIVVIAYYRRKLGQLPQSTATGVSGTPGESTEQQYYQQLQQALSGGSVNQIQRALSQWLNSISPVTTGRPADWSLTASLQPHLDNMLASCYGNGHTKWDKDAMAQAIASVRQQWLQLQKSKQQALPPLYS
ncbi:BatD family protein [Salinimonas lutimaris]|uniref:BatD family protein n=1 Tax=Salinimonas lutimaris TaxID=914153 RepID=UPI0010C02255|nr:BatD family protein [Salinimonas lutimaris]